MARELQKRLVMKDNTKEIETTKLTEIDDEALEGVVGGARVPEETFPVCPAPELA